MKNFRKLHYASLLTLTILVLLQNCIQKETSAADKVTPEAEFYTLDDFKSVEKFDTHVHLKAGADTIFIEQFVMIDDPRFDPIIDLLVEHNIPMIGHLGEPKNTWLPIEEMTVGGDKSYFREHPQYHMYQHPEYPSYEDQIAARDHMLEKHPDLIFVGAHLGSLEWSVDALAERLDRFPNMAVDMAERISHFQYQAVTDWQKVYDFFIKYQDRLLYATDLRASAMDIVAQGLEAPAEVKKHAHEVWLRHWRFFTTDETMNVPKVEKEFKGLKLPRAVVDKIYRKNAQQWIPGLTETLNTKK